MLEGVQVAQVFWACPLHLVTNDVPQLYERETANQLCIVDQTVDVKCSNTPLRTERYLSGAYCGDGDAILRQIFNRANCLRSLPGGPPTNDIQIVCSRNNASYDQWPASENSELANRKLKAYELLEKWVQNLAMSSIGAEFIYLKNKSDTFSTPFQK